MVRRIAAMMLRLVIVLIILGAGILIFPRLVTAGYAWPRLFGVENVPVERVAIVFGAGLRRDGTPTPVLRDRVATAAQLYALGKVQKLLMSGDNRFVHHDEPGAMREYALQLGVPDGDIVLDFAGQRTYDTCFRARDVFQVKSAILVTQSFHLPRAIYVCNALGVPAVGVPADQRVYRRPARLFWNLREIVATLVALWEVHVSRPVPVLGDPEPIFPREAS